VLVQGGDDPVSTVAGRRARRTQLATKRYGREITLLAHAADPAVWMSGVTDALPVTLAWYRPELGDVELWVDAESLPQARDWARTLAETSDLQVHLVERREATVRDTQARARLQRYQDLRDEQIDRLLENGLRDFDEIAGMPPAMLARILVMDEAAAAHLVDAVAIWLEVGAGRP
jgi:hypothetical protein